MTDILRRKTSITMTVTESQVNKRIMTVTKRRNITKTVAKKRGFMTDTKSNGRVVITRTMELCTISDKERVHHILT